jgi:hypothetical protein
MLNYVASLSYLLVAVLCLAAAHTARGSGRGSGDLAVWLSAAALFGLLIAMRLLGGEDVLRAVLRGIATGEGFYDTRMAGQLAGLIVLGGLLGLGWHKIRGDWLKKRASKSAGFVRAALLGMFGFALLYGLRLISLHAVDRILYAGPVRLNWVLEAAFTLILGGAAVLYVRHCRKHAPGQWLSRGADGDGPKRK